MAAYTANATKVLNKYTTYTNAKETLDHDGYDWFGPESNLWDLYVYYIEDGIEKCDHYHREEWFIGEQEEYELWTQT